MPSYWIELAVVTASAVLAGVWGLLRWFSARVIQDVDEKLARIHEVERAVERVDNAHQRLLAELPALYQRRDDAIREYTALTAKLDRMWETLLEIRNHGR